MFDKILLIVSGVGLKNPAKPRLTTAKARALHNRWAAYFSAQGVHLYGMNPHTLADCAVEMQLAGEEQHTIFATMDERIAKAKVSIGN